MITDTHCHLGQYDDPSAVLNAAAAAKVGIVVATENPDEYRRLKSRVGPRPNVHVGLGLHPAGRAARDQSQLSRFFRMLPDATWVSEVGLDFGRATSASDRRHQTKLLESIFEHSMIQSKVVSLHSRGAAKEVVDVLASSGVNAVMHWYSGPQNALDRAIEEGCYFSINRPMLESEKGQKLVSRMPRERVLIETDGPYARVHGAASRPADALGTLARIAALWRLDVDEAERLVTANFDTLVTATRQP